MSEHPEPYTYAPSPCGVEGHTVRSDGLPCERCQKHCITDESLAAVKSQRGAGERIDHPAHYGGADNPYEAIRVIEAWDLGFNLGNAVKYIARAGKKPGTDAVTDLDKARWYIARERARLSGELP